jgi:hypothetical protein
LAPRRGKWLASASINLDSRRGALVNAQDELISIPILAAVNPISGGKRHRHCPDL